MKPRMLLLPITTMALLAPLANAITVRVYEGGTLVSTTNPLNYDPISVTTTYSGSDGVEIDVIGATSSHIGDISINATTPSVVGLYVVADALPPSDHFVSSIGNISSLGGTSLVRIERAKATGDIGTIDVVDIYSVSAGTLTGHVSCVPATTAKASSIFNLHANSALGDITADYGSITELICTNITSSATIGSSGTPVSIRALNTIGYIQADQIYAHISGPVGNELAENVGAVLAANGTFWGSLQMNEFVTQTSTAQRGVTTVGADLDADITIGGDLDLTTIHPTLLCDTNGITRGVFPSGRTITIGGKIVGTMGGSPDSNAAIDVPAGGFQGQGIINGNGSSLGASLWWTAPVLVGSNAVDDAGSTNYVAPYYNATESDLGGGAIGLVPFHMHLTDCLPPNNPDGACDYDATYKTWPSAFNSYDHTATSRETFVIRFYGPVFDSADGSSDDPSTKPLGVEWKSVAICSPTLCTGDLPSWTDETAEYDVYCPGNGAADGSREVWVSRVLDGSGNPQVFAPAIYGVRITPIVVSSHTELRSDKTLAGTAPDVDTGHYVFWPYCPVIGRADGGGDGLIYLDSGD